MTLWLAPSQIADLFADEIASAGGRVADSFRDDARLFTRSVLLPHLEAGPGDRIQGGVALRATESDIFVHPYTFRQVCTNGAIMARATQTRHFSRDSWFLSDNADTDVETTVRAAIRCCCAREAFVESVSQMRSAKNHAVDMAITFAAFMSTHRGSQLATTLLGILSRYDQAGDRSAFGMMNAITSAARDTSDPELKWRLEELGGGVPAALQVQPGPTPYRARARSRQLLEVG